MSVCEIIVDDPLDLKHILIKYYYEELQDDFTNYHQKLENNESTTTGSYRQCSGDIDLFGNSSNRMDSQNVTKKKGRKNRNRHFKTE